LKNIKQILLFSILLILLVTCNKLYYALGSSVEVGIDDGEVKVIIESNLYQNMTGFPEVDANISGSELNMAKSAFEDALSEQAQKPLRISSFSIFVNSDNSWINSSTSFNLDGVSSIENDVILTDLSWISFKVISDLKVGNLSYNLVGEKYLRPAIYDLSNQSGVNFFSPFYTPVTASMAMNIAGNYSTFDLKSVSTNFSSWNKYFDQNSFTTSWNLPTRITLDLRAQIPSENATDLRTGAEFYSYTNAYATLTMPGHGIIANDSIIYENNSGGYSIIMLGVIFGLIGLAIVSRFIGKRLMKT
jgi:hypothetical protein